MATLQGFLSKGYFPKELPPPFESESYGNLVSSATALPAEFNSNHARTSRAINHNYLKVGALRRQLTIPNPLHYYRLSKELVANWSNVQALTNISSISLTTPRPSTLRAVEPKASLADKIVNQARIRANSRYTLKTDIVRFYPSVYSHSIPWAIHTKPVAKVNRSRTLWGNVVDEAVRNMLDGQTVGLPIGPDSSLVIAEILLSQVDSNLQAKGYRNGIRYIDDYEFAIDSLQQAEDLLTLLQQEIRLYELDLNQTKTSINNLPQVLESPWVSELRTFEFDSTATAERYKLIEFIDKTFELSKAFPQDGVIKYAIARLKNETFVSPNWSFLEDLLMQCAIAEPGSLKYVLSYLKKYEALSYPLDLHKIEECLNKIIYKHIVLVHSSEVAWALWGLIELNLKISAANISLLEQNDDPIIALIFLDAVNRGLVHAAPNLSSLQNIVDTNDLYSEFWLLIYEAFKKGWLSDTHSQVSSDPVFAYLYNNNVVFYNEANSLPLISLTAAPTSGGGGGVSLTY